MRILTQILCFCMYIWIIKRPNILAYLGNVGAALYVEEISVEFISEEISVTPSSHLGCSYISALKTFIVKHKVKQSTNKKQTRKCFVYFTKSYCSVFFIAFLIALPYPGCNDSL